MAAAAARRTIFSSASSTARIARSRFSQGDDLSRIKHEILERFMSEQHKVELALKDVEKEVHLTKQRVNDNESRITTSIELSKVTTEAIRSKNALYMVALGVAMCSGIVSMFKLYQFGAEKFPYGLFPLPEEEPHEK